ncbi:MAG: Spy/CpxP family protein refolding chaperone [Polyangiaceae bacterium]
MFWKHAWAMAHGGPCGGRHHHHDHSHSWGPHQHHSRGGGPWSRGGFGVRRPLRFMARQLDLDEDQVAELAAILDDLKNERAQAAVDNRKTVSIFADAFLADSFDEERVAEASAARAASESRVAEAVGRALERTYALLDPEQRRRLAYLLRSGDLTI